MRLDHRGDLMIPANVIHRVFRIRLNNQTGSAFTLDVNGRQYLVTAKHVISGHTDRSRVDIFGNGVWNAIDTQLVGHAPEGIDVTVLAAARRLTPGNLPLSPVDNYYYGQEMYFLGFPFGIQSRFIFGDDGYPLPLVKRAIVSSIDRGVFLLDGHNNPGFSGGAVVVLDPPDRQFKVAGIVSGYKAAQEPILENGVATNLTLMGNTGIIVAYPISHAITLIRANPIGIQLPD